MEIKRLQQKETADFKNLISIFKEVFDNGNEIPNDQHLGQLLANPDFMVFVVKIHERVIGGLTIYVLHRYYGVKPIAYIYDVGIAPDFQGKGYGSALIAGVCAFCKATGFDDAYVEAESDDIDAVNFYRKTNFNNEMQAIHFTYLFAD